MVFNIMLVCIMPWNGAALPMQVATGESPLRMTNRQTAEAGYGRFGRGLSQLRPIANCLQFRACCSCTRETPERSGSQLRCSSHLHNPMEVCHGSIRSCPTFLWSEPMENPSRMGLL